MYNKYPKQLIKDYVKNDICKDFINQCNRIIAMPNISEQNINSLKNVIKEYQEQSEILKKNKNFEQISNDNNICSIIYALNWLITNLNYFNLYRLLECLEQQLIENNNISQGMYYKSYVNEYNKFYYSNWEKVSNQYCNLTADSNIIQIKKVEGQDNLLLINIFGPIDAVITNDGLMIELCINAEIDEKLRQNNYMKLYNNLGEFIIEVQNLIKHRIDLSNSELGDYEFGV